MEGTLCGVYFMAFSFLVTPKFSWLDGPNPGIQGFPEATPATKVRCDEINAPPSFSWHVGRCP